MGGVFFGERIANTEDEQFHGMNFDSNRAKPDIQSGCWGQRPNLPPLAPFALLVVGVARRSPKRVTSCVAVRVTVTH